MITFLAEQAAGFPLKELLSGITGLVVAVIGAILGAPVLKKRWKDEALKDAHVTVKSPVPTIHTKEEVELVTKNELQSHLERIDQTFEEIKEMINGERSIARQANGKLHQRIDNLGERLGERLSSVEGTMRGMNETLSKLLDLALNKPRPR